MHPLAWFAWVVVASLSALLTRNPLYLVLLFGVALLALEVVSAAPRAGQLAGTERRGRVTPVSPVRFALFAIPAGAVFNAALSHFGETVLFRMPQGWPLLGGPITVEALVFGAVNGLVLSTLFAAFAVLNVAVPVRDLIGYLPRAFYPVAVVAAIAVTFVPSTQQQVRQVREAQAVRGHRMRGLRDWLPLFMPVLIGGLERALQLAEAMTARGFAGRRANDAGSAPAGSSTAQVGTIGGLGCVLVGSVLRLMPRWSAWSTPLLVGGVALVGWAIWRTGRGVHHTRYRQHVWALRDSIVVVGAVVALVSWVPWPASRAYAPYPRVAWPGFDVRVGFGLMALILPAVIPAPQEEAHADDRV